MVEELRTCALRAALMTGTSRDVPPNSPRLREGVARLAPRRIGKVSRAICVTAEALRSRRGLGAVRAVAVRAALVPGARVEERASGRAVTALAARRGATRAVMAVGASLVRAHGVSDRVALRGVAAPAAAPPPAARRLGPLAVRRVTALTPRVAAGVRWSGLPRVAALAARGDALAMRRVALRAVAAVRPFAPPALRAEGLGGVTLRAALRRLASVTMRLVALVAARVARDGARAACDGYRGVAPLAARGAVALGVVRRVASLAGAPVSARGGGRGAVASVAPRRRLGALKPVRAMAPFASGVRRDRRRAHGGYPLRTVARGARRGASGRGITVGTVAALTRDVRLRARAERVGLRAVAALAASRGVGPSAVRGVAG